MLWLIIGLLPLVAAPFLVRIFERRRWLAQGLNGFILVTIAGIVFLHVLPHAVEHAGISAVVACLIGVLIPFVVERFATQKAKSRHQVAVVLGLLGLAIHGMLDGVALAAGHVHAHHGAILAMAVLFHRIPVGLAIWWMARPSFGTKGAVFILVLLGVASIAGFVISLTQTQIFAGYYWSVLQALLVGSLLHVVVHQSIGSETTGMKSLLKLSSLVGAGIGIAILLALGQFEHAAH